MHVNAISIRRDGYYGSSYGKIDPSKPFIASIEVQGQHGKVELVLDAELSRQVVAIVADKIAEAGRATAEALTANILTHEPALAIGGA